MATGYSLLLVEDDAMLGEAIIDGLRQDDYDVDWATAGGIAREMMADRTYATILLDLGLPRESGLSLLRGLRERQDDTPVLIITARGGVGERIEGLDAGADDYLIKPFDLDELAARVRALIRRREGSVVSELRFGNLTIDARKRLARLNDAPVHLSAQEFRTLLALARRAGDVLSRRELEQAVYGWDVEIDSNAIEVFIHQLRRKLGNHSIQTVRGFGYCLGEAI